MAEASLQPPQVEVVTEEKPCWAWRCKHCAQECMPIRSSSMCICGHRQQYHDSGPSETNFKCRKCPCKRYFFIMQEGSWVLRCRCKHKHTDHDPNTHACTKPSCKCTCFDSPWVCNCDHAWAEHEHVLVRKQVQLVRQVGMADTSVHASNSVPKESSDLLSAPVATGNAVADEVNNYATLRRGA